MQGGAQVRRALSPGIGVLGQLPQVPAEQGLHFQFRRTGDPPRKGLHEEHGHVAVRPDDICPIAD